MSGYSHIAEVIERVLASPWPAPDARPRWESPIEEEMWDALRRFKELIEADLNRPVDSIFRWIDPHPLGSASLAQTQRARLITGERVVLKVLKPGVRQTVQTDIKLLRLVGRVLQIFLARYNRHG